MLPEPTTLAPTEYVVGRPFTDPNLIGFDLAILEAMRRTLRQTLLGLAPEIPSGTIVHLAEDDGRTHRIVVLNRDALLADAAYMVVGFFGERRPDADFAALAAVDAELVDELRAHPAMLSYSSWELPRGGWANFVLLASPQGATQWKESARHARAVAELTPCCYTTIRIHNGTICGGLGGGPIIHTRTAYYDFQGEWWLAVRRGYNAQSSERVDGPFIGS
jgi:hypothetical protein